MTTDVWPRLFSAWGVDRLLAHYRDLRLLPATTGPLMFAGVVAFDATSAGRDRISDQYEVSIAVPVDFPRAFPAVRETAGRVPKTFHTNPDGTLCLGSPTRLMLALHPAPSLEQFVTRCLVPYLYSYSHYERHGIMPFSELRHGIAGIRDDLASLYGVGLGANVSNFTRLTALSVRVANKAPCPCGSGRRLGRCHNVRVNRLRRLLGRAWFRSLTHTLATNGS
ncbi:MAG: YecA family protein [Vicinamibacterales bacterium]